MAEQNELVVYDAEVQMVEQRRFMPVMALSTAVARRQTIVDATTALMKEGVDYGKIPGVNRDCLLQPGADKLCNLFGLVIQYEILEQVQDWTGEGYGGEPFFYYFVKGRAFRGNDCMGEGVGSCSSWEAKYRWRKAERKCPSCGLENIRKSKEGGWYCWKKTQGCGAEFPDGDKRIESQEVGRKPNTDVHDLVNTVQKMAFKRCKVSTTINATSASEFFTQDVEDNPPQEEPRVTAEQYKEKAAAAKKTEWAKGKAAQQEVLERKMKELEARTQVSPAVAVVNTESLGRTFADPGITDADIPENMGGTYVAPPNPAEQMKAQARAAVEPISELEQQLIDSVKQVKNKNYTMLQHFGVQKKRFQALNAESLYYKFLGAYGAEHANDFPDTEAGKKAARECSKAMQQKLSDMEVAGMVPTGGNEEEYRQDERQALSE